MRQCQARRVIAVRIADELRHGRDLARQEAAAAEERQRAHEHRVSSQGMLVQLRSQRDAAVTAADAAAAAAAEQEEQLRRETAAVKIQSQVGVRQLIVVCAGS